MLERLVEVAALDVRTSQGDVLAGGAWRQRSARPGRRHGDFLQTGRPRKPLAALVEHRAWPEEFFGLAQRLQRFRAGTIKLGLSGAGHAQVGPEQGEV